MARVAAWLFNVAAFAGSAAAASLDLLDRSGATILDRAGATIQTRV